MTQRERILAVYQGRTPDVVPYMLDLSHYYYHKTKTPWDLSSSNDKPEKELIEYHRRKGVGFYVPQLGNFYTVKYENGVKATVEKKTEGKGTEIIWRYETPVGAVERRRIWEEDSYSWGIRDWGVKTERDMRVLAYALSSRTFGPNWDNYNRWKESVGDVGVVYAPFGYSGIGYLLCLWMGIEGTMYAVSDMPEVVREVVDAINENNLKLIDVMAESPVEVVVVGDNISSDIQSPKFFNEWSRRYYAEAVKRLHKKGKYAAIHIDGRLRGILKIASEINVDCSDATTPVPMGDLTPEECRQEAGPNLILSGGVSPNLWLPEMDINDFKKAVLDWVALKKYGPRLIANVGDQVPPGADEDRIEIMRDLVEKHGRY